MTVATWDTERLLELDLAQLGVRAQLVDRLGLARHGPALHVGDLALEALQLRRDFGPEDGRRVVRNHDDEKMKRRTTRCCCVTTGKGRTMRT